MEGDATPLGRRSAHHRPARLAGDEIPLSARIIHVADAYDSMRTNRVYRPARSGSDAVAELRRLAGSQFCPLCANALEKALARGSFGGEILERYRKIAS